MSFERKLETKVDKVLQTNTVGRARQVLQDRSGIKIISWVSFIEAFLPVPILTDPFLIAAILADKKNTFKLIFATTLFSVLGGVAAYLSAWYFFELLVNLMSNSMQTEFNDLIATNETGTFIFTIVGAITPVPYTFAAWGVAILKGNLLTFVVASIIGRGFRYLLVGYSTYRFGEKAIQYAKKYIILSSIILFLVLILLVWLKM
jgi:membrane protein YqaA with SNARE-associated domain